MENMEMKNLEWSIYEGGVDGNYEILSNKVEDVFAEARTTKPHAGAQEFGADAAVHADGTSDFCNIGFGLFA